MWTVVNARRLCPGATEGREATVFLVLPMFLHSRKKTATKWLSRLWTMERSLIAFLCILLSGTLFLRCSLSFWLFFYTETVLDWIIGLIVVGCTLPPFNFGFALWFSLAEEMLEVWGLLAWQCSLSVIIMLRSVRPAWLQNLKCGADLNETPNLGQDQLIYLLKQIRFSWPRPADYLQSNGIVSHRVLGRSLLYSSNVVIADW